MTVLGWLVLAGVPGVLVSLAVSLRLPEGQDADRRTLAVLAIVAPATILPGLDVAALQIAPDRDLACPTDATCSAPYSAPALVLAPLVAALMVAVGRVATRRRWSLRVLVPVLVAGAVALALLVLAGATYRIDVPWP